MCVWLLSDEKLPASWTHWNWVCSWHNILQPRLQRSSENGRDGARVHWKIEKHRKEGALTSWFFMRLSMNICFISCFRASRAPDSCMIFIFSSISFIFSIIFSCISLSAFLCHTIQFFQEFQNLRLKKIIYCRHDNNTENRTSTNTLRQRESWAPPYRHIPTITWYHHMKM